MTLYQFDQLDELEQWQVVWDKAPIAKRTDEAHRYDLYAVDGFYVEVRYIMPGNIRDGLRSFQTAGLLEPYLDQFDISGLSNRI